MDRGNVVMVIAHPAFIWCAGEGPCSGEREGEIFARPGRTRTVVAGCLNMSQFSGIYDAIDVNSWAAARGRSTAGESTGHA
jgi:hypothetical protein